MEHREGLVHARVVRERRREQQRNSSANSHGKGGQKASKNGPRNSGSKNGSKGNNNNNNKSSSSSSPHGKNNGGGASKQTHSSRSTKKVQGKPTTQTKVVNGKTKTMTNTPRSSLSSRSVSSDDTPPQSTMTNLLPPSSSPSSSSNPFATAGPPGYSNSPTTSSGGTHLSGGAIAGIAVGAAVFVLLLALIAGLIARWLTKKDEPEQKPIDFSNTQHDTSSRDRGDYGAYAPSMAQTSYAPYDGTIAPQSMYADHNMYAVPTAAQQNYTHSNMSDDLQQTLSDERKRSVELEPATQEPITALERDNDTFSSGYSDYAYQYQPTTAQDADAALEGTPRQFGSPHRRRFTQDDPYSSELYSQPGSRNILSRTTPNDMYMEVPDMYSTSASERTGDVAAPAEADAEPDVVDEAKAGADELPSARWRRKAHPRRAERQAD